MELHLISANGSELPVWTAYADETGGFNVNVLIPHTAARGLYQVHADGATPAEASLKVAETSEAARANPAVVVEPTTIDPGDVIKVTGTDLGGNIDVPIHVVSSDGSELTVCSCSCHISWVSAITSCTRKVPRPPRPRSPSAPEHAACVPIFVEPNLASAG